MSDEQLQLFQVPTRPERMARGHSATLGHAVVRHDHAVLLAMIAMIAASGLFAFGVERGKRLVAARVVTQTASIMEGAPTPAPASSVKALSSPKTPAKPAANAVPSKPAKAVRTPSKVAAGDSRFVVQVVAYSDMKHAQRELQQLQQRGEKAFLVQRQGKTTLLVGPFPTKENAATKLSNLRQHYRDCFVRTL